MTGEQSLTRSVTRLRERDPVPLRVACVVTAAVCLCCMTLVVLLGG